MFKKMIVPALVLAATSAAAIPAAAQSYGPSHGRPPVVSTGYGNWQSINQRQAQLDRRIDMGVRNGSLSRREAGRLRGEFNSLARLEASYRRGGLSGWERADLDRRFDRLEAQIRYERHDRDNRRG
ncbi:hypothetical protein [Brevundimonas goettingensis]|jgi:hypothetical protein|uniref:Uncharacterized protein n=1 Tax=Brevundimonas goettingensis TaxID=2774190 RepID=A0A975GYB1_9CAUL|nr:hypothetical protein [Brevundimonas goettingensis]QTC91405.1 hypothetical protein IFJ75_00235 [Brevundimonas goettingensis]